MSEENHLPYLFGDAVGRKKGHDLVFCDSDCQEWVHYQCAGLSKANFQSVLSSSQSFYCPRSIISSLLRWPAWRSHWRHFLPRLPNWWSWFYWLMTKLHNTPESQSTTCTPAPQLIHLPAATSRSCSSRSGHSMLSWLLVRVAKMSSGTSRFARTKNDFQELFSIIFNLENGSASSIRDCHWFGKYVNKMSCPRPLLVSLNSTANTYMQHTIQMPLSFFIHLYQTWPVSC